LEKIKNSEPEAQFTISDLILIMLLSMRKVHRATMLSGLFLVGMQQLELPVGKTAVWQSFATWAFEQAKSMYGG
jgi:hypothetical protein